MRLALDAVICLLASLLLFIAATGGVDVDAGGLRLRLHDWTRPALLLAVAFAVRAFARPPRRSGVSREGGRGLSYLATIGMLALLLASFGVYVRYQIRVAGGLDSYGYVSTAHLLTSGRIREPQPLAALLPYPSAMSVATPLGHVPSADGRTSVPRFPLGLPAVMSMFMLFGPGAVYFVPIVMGCVAIALAYLLGRAAPSGASIVEHRHVGGLLAATLLAIDPLFAAYAMQPMSDVPALCWTLAAVWLVSRSEGETRLHSSIAGGVCAGMAVLTRPALMPAAIVLVVATAGRKQRRQIFAFGATTALFIATQFALNTVLYGGPTVSGYGTTAHMFEVSRERLAANVSNFGKWLTYSHTPVFWLLWPGALWILRGERWAWEHSAVAAAAAAPYLFYIVFDDWESSRFLLTAIALILILVARALSHVLRSTAMAPLAMLALAMLCGVLSHAFLQREGMYRLATLEAKFPLTGEWFAAQTDDRAVVLAGLHSGTIRLYGRRLTLRWDQIPDRALKPTIDALVAAGYEPYLALDLPSEPPEFEKRFGAEAVRVEQVARVRVVNIYKFMSAH